MSENHIGRGELHILNRSVRAVGPRVGLRPENRAVQNPNVPPKNNSLSGSAEVWDPVDGLYAQKQKPGQIR
jgi:hypothetical protein